MNDWNGAPVLSVAKRSRREAVERLERLEPRYFPMDDIEP